MNPDASDIEKSIEYLSFYAMEIFIPDDEELISKETLILVKNELMKDEKNLNCRCDFDQIPMDMCQSCKDSISESNKIAKVVISEISSLSDHQWVKYKDRLCSFIEEMKIMEVVREKALIKAFKECEQYFDEPHEERNLSLTYLDIAKNLSILAKHLGDVSAKECMSDLLDPPHDERHNLSYDIEIGLSGSAMTIASQKAFESGNMDRDFHNHIILGLY